MRAVCPTPFKETRVGNRIPGLGIFDCSRGSPKVCIWIFGWSMAAPHIQVPANVTTNFPHGPFSHKQIPVQAAMARGHSQTPFWCPDRLVCQSVRFCQMIAQSI
mmetsp:Transcript_20346/g.36354  ORF Transcript_20346/g.36354 Transcript_20346/m.36354 type:complete len:104 (-) Transcript_20346:536-847(-)